MSYGVGEIIRYYTLDDFLRKILIIGPIMPSTDPIVTIPPVYYPPVPVVIDPVAKLLEIKKTIKALPIKLSSLDTTVTTSDKWKANGIGVNYKNYVWWSRNPVLDYNTIYMFDGLLGLTGSKFLDDIAEKALSQEYDCFNPYNLLGAWVSTAVGAENYKLAYVQSLDFTSQGCRLLVDYTNPFNREWLDVATVLVNSSLDAVYMSIEVRFKFQDFITNAFLTSAYEENSWYVEDGDLGIDGSTNEFVYTRYIRETLVDTFTGIESAKLIYLTTPYMRQFTLPFPYTKYYQAGLYEVHFDEKDGYYTKAASRYDLYYDRYPNETCLDFNYKFRVYMDVSYLVAENTSRPTSIKFCKLSKMPGRVVITGIKLKDPINDTILEPMG